jgi:hypothetical protein
MMMMQPPRPRGLSIGEVSPSTLCPMPEPRMPSPPPLRPKPAL